MTTALFRRHPQTGNARLSTGALVPVPFQCRRADALILIGTVSLASARRWLEGEKAQPIALRDERAPAMLWAMQYEDTVVGPYTELVVTAFARERQEAPLQLGSPYELAALALDPEVRGHIHRLLLPEAAPDAIAYGRELLHLDKEACTRIEIARDPFVPVRSVDAWQRDRIALRLRVGEDDTARTRLSAGWAIIKAAGPRLVLAAARGGHLVGLAPRRLGGGQIDCWMEGSARISPWAKGDECVPTDATLLTAELKEAGFVPKLVQRVPDLKFVMALSGVD